MIISDQAKTPRARRGFFFSPARRPRNGKMQQSCSCASSDAASLMLTVGLVVMTMLAMQVPAAVLADSYWPFDAPAEQANRHSEEQGANLILVMGMPRSASLSFHNYFQCSEMTSSHYCCGPNARKTEFPCESNAETCGACVFHNMNASLAPLSNCGNSQVFSQFDVETGDPFAWFLPQHFTLPLIHESYPKATFILNVRETPTRWADNVMHWYSVTNRFMNSFGLKYHKDLGEITIAPKHDLTNQVLFKELEKSIERAKDVKEHRRRRDELAEVYAKHTDKIRNFVKEHPSHKLVEINVDADAAVVGGQLAAAFSGTKSECWSFDAEALDNDWKDFTLKV